MIKKALIFLFITALPFTTHAVDVAFFIKTKANGEIENLEPHSLYSHVAIRVGDQWLEARPYYGVHLTSDVTDMGTITKIMRHPDIEEPDASFLSEVLGKKYFVFADWDDPQIYNCTKLVAKFLGIPPNPMEIDLDIWGERFGEYVGKLGLSISELSVELENREFTHQKVSSCRQHLL